MSHLFNIEAEGALVAGLIIDESSYDEISVSEEDFYSEKNAIIFGAIAYLQRNNVPIDLVSVCDRIAEIGQTQRVGGALYVAGLLESTTGEKKFVEHYEKIVKDLSMKRQLLSVCKEGIERITLETTEFQPLLNDIQSSVLKIGTENRDSYRPMYKVMKRTQDDIEFAISHAGQVTGVSTGYIDMDRMTGGWQNTDLIVIAARPGMGKSTLMLNLMENAARAGVPSGIFSCEMSERQLGFRMVSRRTHIPVQKIINGRLSPDDSKRLAMATMELANLPIYIDDRGGVSDMDIIKAAKRMVRERSVGIIGIDYLQRIDPANRTGKENEDIGRVCKNFKNLAKTLNIPVVLLAQLNRKVEERVDKRPQLADIKASGDVEQEADIVAFIYRDDYYYGKESEAQGIAEINFAKYRNGRTGTLKLGWDGVAQEFLELQKGDDR